MFWHSQLSFLSLDKDENNTAKMPVLTMEKILLTVDSDTFTIPTIDWLKYCVATKVVTQLHIQITIDSKIMTKEPLKIFAVYLNEKNGRKFFLEKAIKNGNCTIWEAIVPITKDHGPKCKKASGIVIIKGVKQ